MSAVITATARRRVRFSISRSVWMLAPLVSFLCVFFLLPVGQLLQLSVRDEVGTLTLANYEKLFRSAVYLRVLQTTFEFAIWTTMACVVLGYPLAYTLTKQPPRRGWLMMFVLIPFWTSFLVRTFAWLVLLGRNGALNVWLQGSGLTSAPLDMLYKTGSVYIGLIHAMLPLAVITLAASMKSIDRRLVNAARTLGSSPGEAFWRIYFPLSIPGVASAGLLVFVSTIGFFITSVLLGGKSDITIAQLIIDQITDLNWGFAGALGVLLLSATCLAFLMYDRIFGLSSVAPTAVTEVQRSGLATRCFERLVQAFIEVAAWLARKAHGLSRRRNVGAREEDKTTILGWSAACILLVFLAAPSLFVIPISFSESSFIEWPPRGLTLQWYQQFFQSQVWLSALWRSAAVGLASATLSVAIGLPAAFAITFASIRGRAAIVAFTIAPMVVPRVLVAIALYYLYAKIGLVGTSIGLVLGHTILALPFTVITLIGVLKSYDPRFDKAARTLGSGPLRTLWHVTLPLIRPGLIAAFLFAFVTSFDEITVALFITGGLTTTLPKQMWDDAILNVSPAIAAASTVTLLVVSALILISQAVQRRLSSTSL